jgi:hypothetical protein
MEPSNLSAETIQLGKKLVKELGLEQTSNTLTRWMAHYVAELMVEAENAKGAKKVKLEKECCETILKLWGNRKKLPGNASPLSNFTNALQVLNGLNEVRDPKDPYRVMRERDDSAWGTFSRKITKSYESMVMLSILANVSQDILEREKEWLDHPEFLSDEEKQLINGIDRLLTGIDDYEIRIIYTSLNEKEPAVKPSKLAQVLKKISELAFDQIKELDELKRRLSMPKEDLDFPEDDLFEGPEDEFPAE